MSRLITCLYDDYDGALETARDLEASGVPTADISMIANNAAAAAPQQTGTPAGTGAGVGTVLGGGVGLLAGLGILAVPGIGPVVGLGWLAATAVGAVTGAAVGAAAGGLIGSLTEAGIPEADAHVYAEGFAGAGPCCRCARPTGWRRTSKPSSIVITPSISMSAAKLIATPAGRPSMKPHHPMSWPTSSANARCTRRPWPHPRPSGVRRIR